MSTNTEYIHGLRFLALLLRILPAVIFAQNSEFFSSEQGHKLTNRYREIFLIQTAKKKRNTESKPGDYQLGCIGFYGILRTRQYPFFLRKSFFPSQYVGTFIKKKILCCFIFYALTNTKTNLKLRMATIQTLL